MNHNQYHLINKQGREADNAIHSIVLNQQHYHENN